MKKTLKYEDVTEKIISAAYEVHKNLGFGFLEKVYENALAIEMRRYGLEFSQQLPAKVYYKEHIVGDYVADFFVEDKILLEIKAVKNLEDAHHMQMINYLKALQIEVGLLTNFGRKLQIKRKILTQKSTTEIG